MENNITLADIYNVVINLQDGMKNLNNKFNKLEEDFKSLDKKVSDTKKELITKIEDTKQELITYVDKKVDDAKQELITYVDKKVDDAKKELITHVNMKVNYAVHKINEETSDVIKEDILTAYEKLETRVSDLEEFSKTQGYVLKVCEENKEYDAD